MRNLSIRTQIFFGFGLLAILSLAIAAFSLWQTSRIDVQVTNMIRYASNQARAGDNARYLESLRRLMTRTLTDADEATLAETSTATDTLRTALDGLAVNSISERRRAIAQDVRARFEVHAADARAFIAATQSASAARVRLFAAGDALSAASTRLATAAAAPQVDAAARVNTAILLVRAINYRFLATNDPKGAANFTAYLGRANAELANFAAGAEEPAKSLIPPLQAALTAYAADFAT